MRKVDVTSGECDGKSCSYRSRAWGRGPGWGGEGLQLCYSFPEREGAGQPGPLLRALGMFSFASSASAVGGLVPFSPVSVTQLSLHSHGYSQDSIPVAAGEAG